MSGITILDRSTLAVDEFTHELEGDTVGVPASVIFVDAAPGEGPSLHSHPYAELFFVLEGEAIFTDGVAEYPVRAGNLVVAAPEQPHGFVNPGPGPAASDRRPSQRPVRDPLARGAVLTMTGRS